VTRGTWPKKPSCSRGFAREAREARGVREFWGFWGLKTETENQKPKIEKNSLFPSRQQLPKKIKNKILF
jgi:hypothetical protein